MTEQDNQKLWGGRFTESTDAFVEAFTASVDFDRRLAACDIRGSVAHVNMLAKCGIIGDTEKDRIVEGLEKILKEINDGAFRWSVSLEDVHMNIESRLVELVGEVGKKLHTARSRNDQVATDMRLYLREEIDIIQGLLLRLQHGLLDLAEKETETILPGYTHLQVAQPVSFGHHLMAWFAMLERDKQRLFDCRKRVNVLPLGAAALAGTSYPIDRDFVAGQLGFSQISDNSLDAVSDRDFIIEFCAFAAMHMTHLSRFSEELVLWASQPFDFIHLPDRFCTGSSIMPQKKNPDVPELVRGKTGRVFGALMGMLTLMKSQPLAYNKDNQEDKEMFFDTVDTVKNCLRAYGDMVPHIRPKRENMEKAALQGYATATDLADYLVKKGMAFRDAHEVVGKTVQLALQIQCDLSELDIEDLKKHSPLIEDDVYEVLSLKGSLNARNIAGGAAPVQVSRRISQAREQLAQEKIIQEKMEQEKMEREEKDKSS